MDGKSSVLETVFYLLPGASGGNLLCSACVGCRLCCLPVGWREGTTPCCICQEPPNAVIQKAKSPQVSSQKNFVLIPPALTHFFHPCQKDVGEDASSCDPKGPIFVSCSLQSKSWFWPKYQEVKVYSYIVPGAFLWE